MYSISMAFIGDETPPKIEDVIVSVPRGGPGPFEFEVLATDQTTTPMVASVVVQEEGQEELAISLSISEPASLDGENLFLGEAGPFSKGSRVSYTIFVSDSLGNAVETVPVTIKQEGAGSLEPSVALEPLLVDNNLIRLWNFNNSNKEWTYFDPRPVFAPANTVTEIVGGQIYWINVTADQTVVINGTLHVLTEGWNILTW